MSARRTAKRRAQRSRDWDAVDAGDIALLAVLLVTGFLLALCHYFAMVSQADCGGAQLWLSGWVDGAAPLQLFAVIIGLIAVLFLVRLIALARWRRPLRSLAEAAFIATMILATLSVKVHFLPNGLPTEAQMAPAVQLLAGREPVFFEERDKLAAWGYDYPEPPAIRSQRADFSRLFPDGRSPTRMEMRALELCRADYEASLEERRQWREGFSAYLENCAKC